MNNSSENKLKFNIFKKIIFSIFVLPVLFFLSPVSASAATIEVTITITSVTIPVRSEALLISDRPGTGFSFYGSSRIAIVRGSTQTIERTAWLESSIGTAGENLKESAKATLSFPYDAAGAPYTVHAESYVSNQDDYIICKADCTTVPANSEWYYVGLGYYHVLEPYIGWRDSLRCPSSLCGGYSDMRARLAIDPANVFNNYWRSQTLFCIDLEHPELCVQ